jgi:hypothetical protein
VDTVVVADAAVDEPPSVKPVEAGVAVEVVPNNEVEEVGAAVEVLPPSDEPVEEGCAVVEAAAALLPNNGVEAVRVCFGVEDDNGVPSVKPVVEGAVAEAVVDVPPSPNEGAAAEEVVDEALVIPPSPTTGVDEATDVPPRPTVGAEEVWVDNGVPSVKPDEAGAAEVVVEGVTFPNNGVDDPKFIFNDVEVPVKPAFDDWAVAPNPIEGGVAAVDVVVEVPRFPNNDGGFAEGAAVEGLPSPNKGFEAVDEAPRFPNNDGGFVEGAAFEELPNNDGGFVEGVAVAGLPNNDGAFVEGAVAVGLPNNGLVDVASPAVPPKLNPVVFEASEFAAVLPKSDIFQ